MRFKYLSSDYRASLYQMLLGLLQGGKSVHEYTEDFDMLIPMNAVLEDEQHIAC